MDGVKTADIGERRRASPARRSSIATSLCFNRPRSYMERVECGARGIGAAQLMVLLGGGLTERGSEFRCWIIHLFRNFFGPASDATFQPRRLPPPSYTTPLWRLGLHRLTSPSKRISRLLPSFRAVWFSRSALLHLASSQQPFRRWANLQLCTTIKVACDLSLHQFLGTCFRSQG